MTWEPLHAGEPFFRADPEGITRYGAALSTTGERIGSLATLMRDLGQRDNWQMETAEAFKEKAEDLAELISKAEQRYVEAGAAMTRFGGQLDAHVTRAKTLVAEAQEAERTIASNPEATPDPNEDGTPGELTPGQEAQNRRRADAQAHLARLSRDFNAVVQLAQEDADAAEDAVNDAREHGADGFWEKHAGWIRIVAGAIAVIAAIALLVVTSPFWVGVAIFVGIAAGLLALIMSIGRYATGNGPWHDILFDAIGVVTFGAGGLIAKGLRATFPALRGAYASFMGGRASTNALNAFFGIPLRVYTRMANMRIPVFSLRVPVVTRLGEGWLRGLHHTAALAEDAARTAAMTAPSVSGMTRFMLGGRESATWYVHAREMARTIRHIDDVPVQLADEVARSVRQTGRGLTASAVGGVNAIGNVVMTGRDTVLDPSTEGALDTLNGISQLITDLVGRR
jgi:hypothetical protein